ncbi:MAG: DUF1963 domain-containing protein [Acidobacteria bacterium]|nr:DUF1963 domain-containing protein [Acidobacteriota bacterium]
MKRRYAACAPFAGKMPALREKKMEIPNELKPFVKPAWRPVVADGDGSAVASKFAGAPFLRPDEEHPVCPNCGRPLQFFLQLDLAELPDELGDEFGAGLVQLFYCIGEDPCCEVDCEAFFPFAKSVVARLVAPEELVEPFKTSPVESAFPPKRIVGWTRFDDYPSPDEAMDQGVELDDEVLDLIGPHSRDKLAGWPMWSQGVEYPSCPDCGAAMRLVFQLDSDDHLPFMYGDYGCAHLTQCPAHKDRLAFAWACS